MTSAEDIQLKITTDFLHEGTISRDPEGEKLEMLSEKISEYLLKLGYSNDHVLGIVLRLLTQGKVKVEFRDYRERLELVKPSYIVTRGAAIDIFDRYIEQMTAAEDVGRRMKTTQKIIVQAPRK